MYVIILLTSKAIPEFRSIVPTRTSISSISRSLTQWAAVRTWISDINDPVQKLYWIKFSYWTFVRRDTTNCHNSLSAGLVLFAIMAVTVDDNLPIYSIKIYECEFIFCKKLIF